VLQLGRIGVTHHQIDPRWPNHTAGAQNQRLLAYPRLHLRAVKRAGIGHISPLCGNSGIHLQRRIERLALLVH
jgi:hypothetical protein